MQDYAFLVKKLNKILKYLIKAIFRRSLIFLKFWGQKWTLWNINNPDRKINIFGLRSAIVKFEAVWTSIVSKWVKAFTKWIKPTMTSWPLPLLETMSTTTTALRVQWVFTRVKSVKVICINFILMNKKITLKNLIRQDKSQKKISP